MVLDEIPVSPATAGGPKVAADIIGGKAVEVIKVLNGAKGVDGGVVTESNPFPVGVQPLSNWASGQVTINLAAVHIDVTPIANRKTISVRAMATNIDYVYLGVSNAVTTATGYELAPGESIELEINATSAVWGISGTAGQKVCFAEIA